MSDQNSTKSEIVRENPTSVRESLIFRLVDELDFLNLEMGKIPQGPGEYEAHAPLWERHWATRALINRTPARTHSDFRLKAKVFQDEAERDPEFDCEVMGSARYLAPSLVDDALALLAGEDDEDQPS